MNTPDRSEHRELFLDAGAKLLAESPAAISLRALTVRAVATRASKSTGAFYHYWDTQADYILELIPHMLLSDTDVHALADNDALAAAVARFDAEAIFQIFENMCAAIVESPASRVQHMLRSLPDDDAVLQALRDAYRVSHSSSAALYEELFSATGAHLVDGVTFDDLVVMISASADGISMRRRIDPDAAGPETARRMICSLILGVMAPYDSAVPAYAARLDDLLGADAIRHRRSATR